MDCFPSQPRGQLGIQHRLNRFPVKIPQADIAEDRNQVHANEIRIRFLGSIFHRGQHYWLPIYPHKIDELASCLGTVLIAVDALHPLGEKSCCLTLTGQFSNFSKDLGSTDPD